MFHFLIATWVFIVIGFAVLVAVRATSGDDSSKEKSATGARGDSVFAKENLFAWCIVPFDAKKRGPEERAQMLERLGITRLAYDWREQHIATFEQEIQTLKKHGIELTAWWFPTTLTDTAKNILDLLKRHQIKTQLWVSLADPAHGSTDHEKKMKVATDRIQLLAEAAAKIGCTVALYNHGSWFGEPENQLAIIERLGRSDVGIVYNFHHGHDHLDRFPELFRKMRPHLVAVNLGGMVRHGDRHGKKILALGRGDHDLAMMKIIRKSGWRGPVGIVGHRAEADAELVLKENLDGLRKLLKELGDENALKTLG